MKITKWQQELARYYKQGKFVSYFLNNAAKTCLFGLKISENIEIGHVFQSRAFFHLSSNLHTVCLSPFNANYICVIISIRKYFQHFKKNRTMKEMVDYCCNEKIISKGSFILRPQVRKYHQTIGLI